MTVVCLFQREVFMEEGRPIKYEMGEWEMTMTKRGDTATLEWYKKTGTLSAWEWAQIAFLCQYKIAGNHWLPSMWTAAKAYVYYLFTRRTGVLFTRRTGVTRVDTIVRPNPNVKREV